MFPIVSAKATLLIHTSLQRGEIWDQVFSPTVSTVFSDKPLKQLSEWTATQAPR